MGKQLVINAAEHETRVALIENGTIAELFNTRKDGGDITGNIYKAHVQRVLPGMHAAFVDIGLPHAAFIYVNDVVDPAGDTRSSADPTNVQLDVALADKASPRPLAIEDLIAEGQDILVHVVKSPMGTKGARVTMNVSLPGRFLVLMPMSSHVGISRRIEDDDERARLRDILLTSRTEDYGYIVRTASEGVSADVISQEMRYLNDLWQDIQHRFKRAPARSVLHKELDVSLRAVRDLLSPEIDRVVIDSPTAYEAVVSFVTTFMPGLRQSVFQYEGVEPIFDAFNLEGDITRALKRKVWLKSGGYVVIEQTEALVAIDVNTGRYVGKHNLEETILKTNLDAVKEIAYQIRLRDIGGIIIIDFIDMEKTANQEKVYQALTDALRSDRSKTNVLPISEMGLVQMTRKRVREPLTNVLCEPCHHCEGEGFLISRRTVCYRIYRQTIAMAHDLAGDRITLRVNPAIAETLLGEENQVILYLETQIGRPIVIHPKPDFHLEEFDLIEN